MTARVECGWNFGEIGTSTLSVTEASASGTASASFTSGTYCHTDISSVLDGDYDGFAAAVESALEASSTTTRNYTVTWNGTTMAYTISVAVGTIALTFTGTAGTRMRQILGFSGNKSAAASHTSDVRPYFVLGSSTGGLSQVSDDYELDGFAEDAFADGGKHHSIFAGTVPKMQDFTMMFESHAATFAYDAEAAVPWTFEHFLQHARNVEPFLVVTDSANTVLRMKAEATALKPQRVSPDFDEHWNWPFSGYLVGRI